MKLIKKKSIIPMVIIVMTLSVGMKLLSYAAEGTKKTEDKQPKTITVEEYNKKSKEYKNEEEVKKNIKFQLKEPEYKYKNMKKIEVTGNSQSSKFNSFDVGITIYRTDDNREVRIQQVQDTGRPNEILSMSEKISINGVDAWVYGEYYIQIMFWKEGMYYNVSAENVELNELIKIAESIQ